MFFKKPEIKRFNIQPRYWDPAKEEREAREKRIKAELGKDEKDETYVPDVRGQLRSEFERRKAERFSGNGGGRYAIRLFMILIMLFMAVALLIMSNKEGLLRFFGL